MKKLCSLVLVAMLTVSMVGCVGTKVGQNDGRDKDGNIHISIGGSPTERTEENAKTYDIFMANKEKFEQENLMKL